MISSIYVSIFDFKTNISVKFSHTKVFQHASNVFNSTSHSFLCITTHDPMLMIIMFLFQNKNGHLQLWAEYSRSRKNADDKVLFKKVSERHWYLKV